MNEGFISFNNFVLHNNSSRARDIARTLYSARFSSFVVANKPSLIHIVRNSIRLSLCSIAIRIELESLI